MSKGFKVALLGPIDSGKTTFLKTLAGLIKPYKGVIKIDGVVVYRSGERKGKEIYISPERRCVGYVPQELILYPHLTIYQHMVLAVKTLKKV
uniref:ATP-binding cassette domain-containing protein n=1 Tax=Ignisphaera aggregans TaxID=334771 RepID=A0A7J3QEL5_9CREN